MKKSFLKSLIVVCFAASKAYSQKGEFKIQLTNLEKKTSNVYVAWYKKGTDFPKDNAMSFGKIEKSTGKGTELFNWSDIPAGEYAIAVFQDINGNGKLDTNFMGIPNEPYAFSNNFKPKFSAPKYADCKFSYDGGNITLNLKMIK